MEIKLNEQYLIRTSKLNITLYEISVTGEKAKVPGEKKERSIGSYPTIEAACSACVRQGINSSDLSSLYKIIEAIHQAEKEITKSLTKVADTLVKKLMG